MASNTSRYYIPSTVPLLYCSASLDVALKESKKAREIYGLIVESYQEPGMQAVFQKLQSLLPHSSRSLEIFKDEARHGAESARKANRKWQPDLTFLFSFIFRVTGGFRLLWFLFRVSHNPDFKHLMEMADDLIKVAFNRVSDQEKGQYKVTSKSSLVLAITILIKAYAKYLKVEASEEDGKAILKVGSKYHDLSFFLPENRSTRLGRIWTSGYREEGYRLLHTAKIEQVAERWYGCRVVYSGVTEYCDRMAFKGKSIIPDDPSNISNEIKECDKAMGYPRSKSASK